MADGWQRFQEYLYRNEELGFALDISRMHFPDGFFTPGGDPDRPINRMPAAFAAMEALEAGAIANPDEERMVGHYWLRAPELAPTPQIRRETEEARRAVKEFAAGVHAGGIAPPGADKFHNLLLIGIGGSALGPQLLAEALWKPNRPMRPFFLDNTDPDGFDRVFVEIEQAGGLAQTLTVVTSKSGRTRETRNGMLAAKAAYERAGLAFGPHAAAVTDEPSELLDFAREHGFRATFPMWDWVGGRTSIFSPVGLLPAALLGVDVDAFLRGAAEMDQATRVKDPRRNPAALLALMWHHAGQGHGAKDMVVLPYKDRLELFPRYLQQLVMESLGKELDLESRKVNQGIVVYGNKGSTDQHAYVQQLREGANNFLVTFIQVLRDRLSTDEPEAPLPEDAATSGDYLLGFLLGTRHALAENGRESLTITLDTLDAASLGRLIAVYERAVGLYASLIGVNAYHQPGVEAGKRAAERVIGLQDRVLDALSGADRPLTAEEAAREAGALAEIETAHHLLLHLAANGRGVTRYPGSNPAEDRFIASSGVKVQ
jgi:glucose-6-phosphate isomerase